MKIRIIVTISLIVASIVILMLSSLFRAQDFLLDQDDEFYKQHELHTKIYLSRVYPVATKTIMKMGWKDIAVFFNKLDFLYNCCYKYNGNLTPGQGWDQLKCCNDIKNHLPYP